MKTINAGISKYRVLISKKINKLLLGKLSGNTPATIVNSVEEDFHLNSVSRHVNKIVPISQPTIAHYPFPESFPVNFRRFKAFDKKNLYLLKNVTVSPFSGLTWLENKHFLVESIGSLYRLIGWDNVLHEPLLPSSELTEQDVVVSCPKNPFYHWVFESLAGLLVTLEHIPNAKVMIPANSPQYCQDVLKLIFDEKTYAERIIVADGVKQVPNFAMFQQEQDAGFVHPVTIRALQNFRDKVLGQVQLSVPKEPMLYISRSKTSNRSLANEEELEKALEAIGFTIIYSEQLSLAQQIVLFSQASFIIAPHGAGLSNIVWTKGKARLLEIFAHNHFNDCFARLAAGLGFNYRYTQAGPHPGTCGRVNVQEIIDLTTEMLKTESRATQQVA
ncbi:glycosyltransferase family 61 protein [Pontibacter populi]|uniref:Glycosyltransferase family 61 protein n=1 Tax=Pontibacter populi TaxID=890055 RepID=A0ABV1RXY9_9BACT